MKLSKALIFLVTGIILCSIMPTAMGIVISEEEFNVDPDKWQALALSGAQMGILQIDVEVLTEYAQIDVLIMNEYNWYRYNTTDENKEFEYYTESRLNTKLTSFTFTAPENDVYYIVIDNSRWPKTPENPEDGAYMTFPVNVHVTVSDVTNTPSIGIIGVITSLGLVFFVFTVVNNKRRKKKRVAFKSFLSYLFLILI
jgi:hypothetical protein